MTNHVNDDESSERDDCQIMEENAVLGTWNRNNDNLLYDIAMERNRVRWEYQEEHEKAAIEMYINEDVAVKQRRSICQAMNLSEIVLNIQEALHSGVEHDLPKATENLRKLLREPFSTMALLYAPYVVKTVYLCCRYEKSSLIRALAKECYSRFEPCFGVPEGETFETAFQAEVREFWEKQNTVCDPSLYDQSLFTMDDDPSVETENNFEGDEKMKIELKHIKNETKVKIENIKIKCEPDDKSAIKTEPLDDKSRIKKEVFVKTESIDDKRMVKKEAINMKVECKTEMNDVPFDSKVTIKEEMMDSDDVEITYTNIKPNVISNLPKLTVKLEPIDLEKLNMQYNSDEDCYIVN